MLHYLHMKTLAHSVTLPENFIADTNVQGEFELHRHQDIVYEACSASSPYTIVLECTKKERRVWWQEKMHYICPHKAEK